MNKIDKVERFIKNLGNPVCIHTIENEFGVEIASASALLRRLEFGNKSKKPCITRTQKGTCKYSDTNHTHYNYNDIDKIEAKRSADVGRMLRTHHTKELKKVIDQYEKKLKNAKKIDPSIDALRAENVATKTVLKDLMIRTDKLIDMNCDLWTMYHETLRVR
jgi:hypothetical protein